MVQTPEQHRKEFVSCSIAATPMLGDHYHRRMATETINAGDAGRSCPYCLSRIAKGEQGTRCDECGAIHHSECWTELNGCTTFGCKHTPRTSGLPAELPNRQLEVTEAVRTIPTRLELPKLNSPAPVSAHREMIVFFGLLSLFAVAIGAAAFYASTL